MPKFDAFDEAVIEAPPVTVFKIILNEFSGLTHFISGV